MFRIGQKVVCINDVGTNDEKNVGKRLQLGQIYTVRWIGMFCCWWFDPEAKLSVRLAEIARRSRFKDDEDCPYRADRFRPLVETKRETDITVFKKLLNPTPVLEDA